MFWGWWVCLDWKIRYGSAIGVLLVAGMLVLATRSSEPRNSLGFPIVQRPDQPPPRRDYRSPIMFGAIGFVMLMFAGRSKAETLGYQDF